MKEFFYTHPVLVPVIALLAAIVFKGIFHALAGRFSIAGMLGSGGMPSAHSTFVVALTTMIGIKESVWSNLFAVCLVFSIIIIYDAMNVRYQSGLHARRLNKLAPHRTDILNESMGHTPLEAFAGGIIGFLTAAILMLV
ncbi:hypothetical protein CSB09_02600 [Candidatus Gracilibacteria bacterium]|nr:MAG: hypothetical protein CSB09_02600 [Candidatus Gracilibacteria bacterium]